MKRDNNTSKKERRNKPWGHEKVLYRTDDLIVLRMFLKAGEETSLHKHLKHDEVFVVLKGNGRLVIEDEEVPFNEKRILVIQRGKKHRWFAREDVEVLEVTTPPLGDSVRVEDKYDRKLGSP